MRVLCARLYEQQRQAAQDATTAERRAQGAGHADRSERIRTYNFAQVPCLVCRSRAGFHEVALPRLPAPRQLTNL